MSVCVCVSTFTAQSVTAVQMPLHEAWIPMNGRGRLLTEPGLRTKTLAQVSFSLHAPLAAQQRTWHHLAAVVQHLARISDYSDLLARLSLCV